ncbi:HisA/HisF-related TIM barrel protein [Prochlorococcus sp. AH-736-N03]|nr:HisA/HisF-related TIM barrel protein [Prochlorococcus sp. AH-736-N03]
MLKKRIIALLLIRENIVVQSVNFKRYLPVGKPEIAVEALNDWGIDEIIVLDICARRKSLAPNKSLIREIAPYTMIPLTVGGGYM